MKYNDRLDHLIKRLKSSTEEKSVPFLDVSFVLAVSIAVGLMLAQEFLM